MLLTTLSSALGKSIRSQLQMTCLPLIFLLFMPVISAQKAIQLKARAEGWRVADMHYHVSNKVYNRCAYPLLHRLVDSLNQKSKETYGRDNLQLIPDTLLWSTMVKRIDGIEKGLDSQFGGKIFRPKKRANHLKKYDQATHPHSFAGNVKLGFNAFIPFEYKTAETPGDRLYHKCFVSKASFEWLRKVGDWKKMTHFENFMYEHAFMKSQESDSLHYLKDERGDTVEFKWKFLRSGSELKNDSNTYFIVNVIEGGHALQDSIFHPMKDGHSLRLPRFVRKLHRKKELSYDHFVKREDIEDSKYLKKLEEQGVDTTDSVFKVDTSNKKIQRILRRAGVSYDWDTIAVEIKNELMATINTIKQLDPPIFMVTVGHFTYNGMVNHALALNSPGFGGKLLRRIYRVRVDDDPNFMREWEDKFYAPPKPLTDLGEILVNELMDTTNGHRIHIDLKHAGYPVRNWFYEKADSLNRDTTNNDVWRPICSHCAATGLKDNHYSPIADEYAYADSKSIMPFSPFSINLYDGEIQRICELGGIIGITLEEGRLGGYQNIRKRRKIIKADLNALIEREDTLIMEVLQKVREELETIPDLAKQVVIDDYCSAEPFMQNLFYILHLSKKTKKEAWQHVCLGSDFDGIIDPIDIVPTASQYPYFRNRLQQLIPIFMELNGDFYDPDRFYEEEALPDAFTLEKALDLLFYESLRNFVRDNFTRSDIKVKARL